MQKSLVALSTIAALGLFACQPNTSDEAASTSADSAKTTSVSAEEMTDTQKQAYAFYSPYSRDESCARRRRALCLYRG